jgi:hypothetical protein
MTHITYEMKDYFIAIASLQLFANFAILKKY